MYGLTFEEQTSVVAGDPNRMDIACFVGCVSRRPGATVPRDVRAWLEHHLGSEAPPGASIDELLDVPVPVDSWEVFNALFKWESRPTETGTPAATYLGSAVRSFFAQGGRKCYVVRVADELTLGAESSLRDEARERLLPGTGDQPDASPVSRRSWSGAAHVLGLPDVAMLCLPDLPELVAEAPLPVELPQFPPGPEVFVACSEEQPPEVDTAARVLDVPRCGESGYQAWARMLRRARNLIARSRRDVQLVAAVPLPLVGTPAEANLLEYLVNGSEGRDSAPLRDLGSAFVQLAYPWVATPAARLLPGGLESPDGVLAGMLARGALIDGAYRSIAGQAPLEVTDVYPVLSRDQIFGPVLERHAAASLAQRISTFARVPGGIVLLSDVTASRQEAYRQAATNRLVASIVRAARLIGEEAAFEANGEALWARIERGMTQLMLGFLREGVLAGATPDEAFLVRCDRSTMTQNDLDNGRAVCVVEFAASLAIERIAVVLAIEEGGQVSLIGAAATEGGTA